jgi:hypothetical protein
MLIPQVAEVRTAGELVRFFWCWSCEELFAFVGGACVLAAGFACQDGSWRVFRRVGNECDTQMAVTAVAQVGPQR